MLLPIWLLRHMALIVAAHVHRVDGRHWRLLTVASDRAVIC